MRFWVSLACLWTDVKTRMVVAVGDMSGGIEAECLFWAVDRLACGLCLVLVVLWINCMMVVGMELHGGNHQRQQVIGAENIRIVHILANTLDGFNSSSPQ